ncbi:beta-class phenol-soluble modulin [Staphylococcus equorum]
MEGLFEAIKNTVQAGIVGDGVKIGSGVLDIISNGAALISQALGF